MPLHKPFFVLLALALANASIAERSAPAVFSLRGFGVSVALKATGLQLRGEASLGSFVMPTYPEERLNEGSQGECEVMFALKEDGSVAQIKAGRSSGQDFTDSALAAVSKWKFPRWKWIEKPKPVSVTATFYFRLSDE